MTNDQILETLASADSGELAIVSSHGDWSNWKPVTFKLANGWTVTAYNHCGEWRYVDAITFPDGSTRRYTGESGDPLDWIPGRPELWGNPL